MRLLPVLVILAAFLPSQALAQSQSVSPPKCDGPEHRQFDFWVGEWEVRNPAGQVVGTNRIERIQDGCALQEHWTGARGGGGTSLNFYDRATRRWHQTWISSTGGALHLDGGLVEGRMVLEGEADTPRGKVRHRITWSREAGDGRRVRQHWETSSDGGKTWTTTFDGTYVPKS